MPLPQDFDLQRNSVDRYLSGQARLPVLLDEQLLQRVIQGLTSQPQLLQQVFGELQKVRSAVVDGLAFNAIVLPANIDTAIGFSNYIQSRLVASQAINAEEKEFIRQDILEAIDELLHCVAAISIQSKVTSPESLSQQYSRRYIVHLSQQLWLDLGLNAEVVKEEDIGKAQYQTWIPLRSIQQFSTSELLRVVLRTTIINPQIDNDLNSLLYQLAKGVHLEWSPKLQTDSFLLWQRENDMLEWVSSQETRDRIGAQFAPYLAKLLAGTAHAYDPEFHSAFNAVLQAVQLYYQTYQAPAVVPTGTGSITPITPMTPPTSQVWIPVATEPLAPPTLTPTSDQPVAVPGATVDLRTTPPESAKSSAPPIQPESDKPRIKPINIQ